MFNVTQHGAAQTSHRRVMATQSDLTTWHQHRTEADCGILYFENWQNIAVSKLIYGKTLTSNDSVVMREGGGSSGSTKFNRSVILSRLLLGAIHVG